MQEQPDFTPHLPGDDEGESLPLSLSVEDLLLQFRRARGKQLAEIERYGDEVWQRRADHPEYSLYTAVTLVRHILMHDHWHMYRMEELWLTRDAYLTELH